MYVTAYAVMPSVCMYVCMYACMFVCLFVCIYVCIYVYGYMYYNVHHYSLCVCVFCMYACMCVCMYAASIKFPIIINFYLKSFDLLYIYILHVCLVPMPQMTLCLDPILEDDMLM